MASGEVIVISSINQDVSITVAQHPQAGETTLAKSTKRSLGGKGANVAVAAAKSGGARTVQLVGAVGSDGNGLLEELCRHGVDVRGVRVDNTCDTGLAVVVVEEDSGENRILVCTGANSRITEDAVWEGIGVARGGREVGLRGVVVVFQLEIALHVTEAVAWRMAQEGAVVVLNPSPVPQGAEELFGARARIWQCLDIVVVNEVELQQLCGGGCSLDEGIHVLKSRCAARTRVVVTLGPDGVAYCEANEDIKRTAAIDVKKVVDSTAAGDTFTGALCGRLACGMEFEDCVRYAVVAAGICVERAGAAESIATAQEVEQRLAAIQ